MIDLVVAQFKGMNANALTRRDASSVPLRLNWPLFSGLETQSRVAAAYANQQSSMEREAADSNRLTMTHDSLLANYRMLAAPGALTPAAQGLESGSFALPLKTFGPGAGAIAR